MTRKAGSGIYKKTLQVKIKPMTHEKLKEIAKIRGDDVSKVVRSAIEKEVYYSESIEYGPTK